MGTGGGGGGGGVFDKLEYRMSGLSVVEKPDCIT